MLEVYLPVTGEIKFRGYATVCAVCFKPLTEWPLKKCSGCKLVYYCCKDHQMNHWPNHKQLCKAVQLMIKRTDNVGLFDDYIDEGFSLWVLFRRSLIYVCEGIMKRKLTHEERGLFLYPLCCKVCHVHNHNHMITCSNCSVTSYCSEDHKEKDKMHHLQVCKYVKFGLDFERNCREGFFIKSTITDTETLPPNMEKFIADMVDINTKPVGKEIYGTCFLSNSLSIPLTIIYIIEKSEIFQKACNELLTLHIVGSGQYENLSYWSWELILHYFNKLKSLNLVLIGPESSNYFLPPVLSCHNCKNTKLINFTVDNNLYHEFVKQNNNAPDVIIAFNCGFHEFEDNTEHDTWKNSMKSLFSFPNKIVAFTSYNENESLKDLKVIKKFCGKESVKVIVEAQENPYRSLIPLQDWYNEGENIFYNSYFINIVQT